jgi:hypothetical protein
VRRARSRPLSTGWIRSLNRASCAADSAEEDELLHIDAAHLREARLEVN